MRQICCPSQWHLIEFKTLPVVSIVRVDFARLKAWQNLPPNYTWGVSIVSSIWSLTLNYTVRTHEHGRFTQALTGPQQRQSSRGRKLCEDWCWARRSLRGLHVGISSQFYPITLFNCTGEIPLDWTRGFPMESPLEPEGDPHKLRPPFLQPIIALVVGI